MIVASFRLRFDAAFAAVQHRGFRCRASVVNQSAAPRPRFLLSRAEWVLVLITLFWGATFLIVQNALSASGPMFFVGLRFASAAIIMALISLPALRQGITRAEWQAGLAIGIMITIGYGLQTVGLQTILSSQSAFITALYVPAVPLLQWLFWRKRPSRVMLLGVVLSFVGLALLAGPEGLSLQLAFGEWMTLIGAFAIAAEIIFISLWAGRVDTRRATVVQLAMASLFAFLAMIPAGESIPPPSALLIGTAIGLGLMSALIQFGMNWAQRSVSATRATLIYAGEPLWAALIGRVAGERLPFTGLLGGLLIVAAIVVSSWRPRQR